MNTRENRIFFRYAGIAVFLFLAYSVVTMIILIAYGVQPKTAIDCFDMLQKDRIIGLLRMDLLTLFFLPLYYIIFWGIYQTLDKRASTKIAIFCIFIGVTLVLATPSVFSMMNLSDKYAEAISNNHKEELISAGEAILASDLWHGSGAIVGGIIIQFGAILLSMGMLKGNIFNKLTGYIGLITFSLDLLHILFLLTIPVIGTVLMAIGGTFYIFWLPLVGIKLMRISRE